MTSFTTSGRTVLLSGVALTDHRVEDLLTFYQAREAEAEAAAALARRAFLELWDARCKAVDQRSSGKAVQP